MAPIHHHFELLAGRRPRSSCASGSWPRSRARSGSRSTSSPSVRETAAPGRPLSRRRAGAVGRGAAVRMLPRTARWSAVRRRRGRERAGRRRGPPGHRWTQLLDARRARSSRARGCRSRRPSWRVRASAASPVSASSSWLEDAAEPVRRGDRHERQDDHHRAARRDLARRRPAGRRRRERGHAAVARWWARSIPRRRSSARCRASSSRTRAFAPERRSSSTSPRTTSTGTARSRPTATAKLRMFANQDARDARSAVAPPGFERPRGRGRGGVRASARAAALDAGEMRLRGAHNLENAMRRRGRGARRRRRPRTRCARRCGTFAGVPHRLEEVGDAERRAVRERLEGDERGGRGGGIESFDGRGARDPRRSR